MLSRKLFNERTTGYLRNRWSSCVILSDLFFAEVGDFIVEIVLERRLGHDRFEPNAVDGLALKLRSGSADFDLVSRPVVGVAERIFERLPIGAVEHHGLVAVFV